MPLDSESLTLAALLFLAAVLYSSVGHAGASGYLAAMALIGIAPHMMKPTALALNVLVAVIATFKFYRVAAFSWRLFLPLAVSAAPFAYWGGQLLLPAHLYKALVGAVLIYAAWRLFHTAKSDSSYVAKAVSVPVLVLTGSGLGFLSGLIGVGGGIFLSPLFLFLRWAPVKVISGVAAAFILVNSVAGIMGVMASSSTPTHPALPLWALAVVVGGFIGAEYGSRRLGDPAIQRLLALVLLVAGAKMVATA